MSSFHSLFIPIEADRGNISPFDKAEQLAQSYFKKPQKEFETSLQTTTDSRLTPTSGSNIVTSSVFPRSASEALFDSSSKFRQLPCRTFISVGTCPYRERCVYLHDPRCICREAKTKTRRKNKEDVVVDALFWPVMPYSLVAGKLDGQRQPHVIQPYSVPIPQYDNYRSHDQAVYSCWMHFVDFCMANNETVTKDGVVAKGDSAPCYQAPDLDINAYTEQERLQVFIKLSRMLRGQEYPASQEELHAKLMREEQQRVKEQQWTQAQPIRHLELDLQAEFFSRSGSHSRLVLSPEHMLHSGNHHHGIMQSLHGHWQPIIHSGDNRNLQYPVVPPFQPPVRSASAASSGPPPTPAMSLLNLYAESNPVAHTGRNSAHVATPPSVSPLTVVGRNVPLHMHQHDHQQQPAFMPAYDGGCMSPEVSRFNEEHMLATPPHAVRGSSWLRPMGMDRLGLDQQHYSQNPSPVAIAAQCSPASTVDPRARKHFPVMENGNDSGTFRCSSRSIREAHFTVLQPSWVSGHHFQPIPAASSRVSSELDLRGDNSWLAHIDEHVQHRPAPREATRATANPQLKNTLSANAQPFQFGNRGVSVFG